MRFREAVVFAYAMDWPLNIGITITWTALETAGERNEGHCLGRGEWDREKYTRDELAVGTWARIWVRTFTCRSSGPHTSWPSSSP
jgi:hypothetical protein